MVTRIDSVQDVLAFLETVSPQLAAQCATEIENVWREIAELEDELPGDAGLIGPIGPLGPDDCRTSTT